MSNLRSYSHRMLTPMLPLLLAGMLPVSIAIAPVVYAQTNTLTSPSSSQTTAQTVTTTSPIKILTMQVESATGNLVIQTDGHRVAPKISTDKSADGLWQIAVQMDNTHLTTDAQVNQSAMLAALKNTYPGVQTLSITPNGTQGLTVKITLKSDTELSPQVASNTGSLITVALREPAKPREPEVLLGNNTPAARPTALGYYQWFLPSEDGSATLDGLVRQAWNDYISGNTATAAFNLKSYLDRVPEDDAARYLLQMSYQRMGDWAASQKELKILASRQPSWIAPLLELARLKLEHPTGVDSSAFGQSTASSTSSAGGADPELAKIMQHLKTTWPEHPDVLFLSAQSAMQRQQPAEARRLLMDLIAKYPGNTRYDLALAKLEKQQNRPEAARVAYLRVASVDPENPAAAQALAEVALKSGQPEAAMKHYANALSPQALLNYAMLLRKNNRAAESLSVLKAARLAMTDSVSSQDAISRTMLYDMGMLFADLKDNDSAQKTLKQFVEAATASTDATGSTESDKRVTEARNTLRRLSSAAPSSSTTTSPRSTGSSSDSTNVRSTRPTSGSSAGSSARPINRSAEPGHTGTSNRTSEATPKPTTNTASISAPTDSKAAEVKPMEAKPTVSAPNN